MTKLPEANAKTLRASINIYQSKECRTGVVIFVEGGVCGGVCGRGCGSGLVSDLSLPHKWERNGKKKKER